ncbi:MAG: phosphomannose isomerase type II C-terminal cupin domain [Planctomycetes bacterium]|nr:phosphomannose isomerase type II C-terminal cupin domain [Planctomycetota bacterium]
MNHSPSHERKPWGEYRVLHDAPGFKVKRVDVAPGQRLSYQRHAQRAEHWVIVAGRARVTLEGRELELVPGQALDIAPRQAHRIQNIGAEMLSFIEVQTGSYFGEDDIERLTDDYGRADSK